MNDIASTPGTPLNRRQDAKDARTTGRGLRAVVWTVLAAAALGIGAGFAAFVVDVSTARPPVSPQADGIVVLTGGGARIDAALRLLSDGRARRLLISGVNPQVDSSAIASTVDAKARLLIGCCVDLGHEARDTIGNAAEARDWVRRHGYGSIIVVTSAYHMPRSLAELADAMPDIRLVAYPIANPELNLTQWSGEPRSFGLLAREYAKYLLAAARLALGTPVAGYKAAEAQPAAGVP